MAKNQNRYDVYVDNQYVNAIEPFFYMHINYAQVTGNRRQYPISGGPETDFNQFFNDLELWNLLNFKIESIEEHQNRLNQCIVLIDRLNKSLKLQLVK